MYLEKEKQTQEIKKDIYNLNNNVFLIDKEIALLLSVDD